MTPRSTRRSLLGSLGALALFSAASAEPDPWDWTTLEMSAHSSIFLSGRVELTLDHQPARTLLETTTSARLFGALVARSRTQSILHPATGAAREYFSFSPKRGRHYIFNEKSYVVKRLAPRVGYDAPIEGWDVESSDEFPYPQGAEGPLPVHDPYGMLINLKRMKLDKPGDEAVMFVATSRGPQRYTIRVGESRPGRQSFKNGSSRKKHTVDTEEFLLVVEPDEDNEDEKGLMGMRGSIEIWVEARSKTLIRVSGKVPDIPGRVVLKLSVLD